MKIYIPNYEPNRIGGGWTFTKNFVSGLGDSFTENYDEANIYFIPGASMATHEQVEKAKADNKKIVLRNDNVLRDSRNRGTGMSRMKAFAEASDLVIYQSKWARGFLEPFLGVSGPVILNGTDLTKFNPDGRWAAEDSYLYVRSSRDEGKQWIMAWYWFVNNEGHLDIVGKFSPDNLEWGFDFYNGERFTFLGEQKDMAPVYKRNRHFLYSYTFDACSNTLLEALASGCEIINVGHALETGGAPEIMACKDISVERMVSEYKEAVSVL